MSSVCAFLTMLERDAAEANGNVRRMLSVCSEFERIARVVLDKAERDMRGGRGKRKAAEREKLKDKVDQNSIAAGLDEGKTLEQIQVETQAGYRRPVQTPSLKRSQAGSVTGGVTGESPASFGSPAGGTGPEYRTPGPSVMESGFHMHQQQPQTSSGQWTSTPQQNGYDMSNGGGSGFTPQNFGGSPPQMPNFSQPGMVDGPFNPPSSGFTPGESIADLGMNHPGPFAPPPNIANGAGSFQQPFVPQDLWQMPMTLEWDWAEGLGLGSFTPGPMFDDAYGLGGLAQDNIGGQHMQQ